jgi:RNA polymerase sigma-70 factor (ECF subfamily)
MSTGPAGDPEGASGRDPGEGAQLLITRLRSGDSTALRELYHQEERRAFAVAFRVVGDVAVAQDAVQEAFVQLWERADRITLDGGRLESLLMTIVRRRALDMARRRHRAPRAVPDVELMQRVDDTAAALLDRVEEDLTAGVLRRELQTALSMLPLEQRIVVDHAYFGGLTLREIAGREQLPLGTVKSRLRLAMTKLSQTMNRQGVR